MTAARLWGLFLGMPSCDEYIQYSLIYKLLIFKDL